jgi:hypothetical protein
MAKSVKKETEIKPTISKIETVEKECITCGKQFANDFFSVVQRKKQEYEKFKINYYVFKNKNNDWSIAEEVSFNIFKEKDNIKEWFHIREFEPK